MMRIVLILLAVTMGAASEMMHTARQKSDGRCTDEEFRCPEQSTCCNMEGGQRGCCPFPHATCCADSGHCCPRGYSCDIGKQQCVKEINNDTITWAKKEPAPVSSTETDVPQNIVCPDGSSCPALSACCRTYAGAYRCCNYPNNVCCADGYHCCQRCSVCDFNGFKCLPGFVTSKWTPLSVKRSSPSRR